MQGRATAPEPYPNDALYARLANAHEGLTADGSAILNAKLLLMLAASADPATLSAALSELA